MRNLNPVKPDNPEEIDLKPGRKTTAGEKIFDRTVYTGIGLGVNEGLSLWVTDQFMHGKNLFAKVPGMKTAGEWFSKPGYERATTSLTKALRLTDKVSVRGHTMTAHERGANSLLMLTLIAGGTSLVLPMKWLEDSKAYWVKKANHMVDGMGGNKLSAEGVAARDEEVERHIACSPRQSWPSMMMGRTIAVGTSWATGTFLVGPRNNAKLMEWSEKQLTGSVQPKGRKEMKHRYAGLASVETYSAGIAAVMLEIMSKTFAKRGGHPHDPELCKKYAKIDAAKADAAPALAKEDNTKESDDCPGKHCANIQSQRDEVDRWQQMLQV